MADMKEKIIAALQKAYCMELETVLNYLANSIHLEGVRAEQIQSALAADIQEELGHARQVGERIKQLDGQVPGSLALVFDQKHLQPPADPTDVVAVIRGVLEAEDQAIRHYKSIIELTEKVDYVTQHLAITLLAQEEAHWHKFEGYLKEYFPKG